MFPTEPTAEAVTTTTFVVEVATTPRTLEDAVIAVVIAVAASVVELPFPTEAVTTFCPFNKSEIVPLAVEVAPATGPTKMLADALVIGVTKLVAESYSVISLDAAGKPTVMEWTVPAP